MGPQARKRGVDQVGEDRGREGQVQDEREEGREVGVEWRRSVPGARTG